MGRSIFQLSDDLVFRAFLSAERLAASRKGLVNSVMREAGLPQVRSLTVKNPFLLETWENEKEPILDIRVIDEEGREYDVEMQCRREKYYVGRVVSYTFRLHVDQLERGKSYGLLKRTVGISFTAFPLDPSRPDLWFDVWKYHSTLGTGLGYEEAINIFVRLPTKPGEQPVGIKDPELLNWLNLLAFYPNLSDEKIALIKQSTFGATELIQEAEMFIGTDQERVMMQARERYWHDVASRYEDYIIKIDALEAINSSLEAEKTSWIAEKSLWATEKSSLVAENSSLAAENSSLAAENLNVVRKSLATILKARFNTPVATSLACLNKIDSSEKLDKLLELGSNCESYDVFLKNLTSCKVES